MAPKLFSIMSTKYWFTLWVLMGISWSVSAQQRLLVVVDASDKSPIVDAHIHADGQMIGYSDANGAFTVNPDITSVFIQSVGFNSAEFKITTQSDTLALIPKIYHSDQNVVVYGKEPHTVNVDDYTGGQKKVTLDQMLSGIDGVAMIQRGAFAWEPSVRGMNDQRIGLTIDGMQVFKACVDKMDPVTAYVASDNLSELNIDKNGNSVAEQGHHNASVNLITKKPDFNPFSLNIKSAYRVPDHYRQLTVNSELSKRNHAFRFSGNFNQANDLVAGNDSSINNSGYNKLNANIGYRFRTRSNNILDVSYLVDEATDVGYPALLMDATRATAHMFRMQYQWRDEIASTPTQTLMAYANSVVHKMDDYNRDVANRAVMRGMYMPMDGTTETYGFKYSREFSKSTSRFTLFSEGFSSLAFGDMLMESIYDNIADMYLINLGDIRTNSLRLGNKINLFPRADVHLKLEQSLGLMQVNLGDEGMVSFFEGLYGSRVSSRFRLIPAASVQAMFFPEKSNWNFSISSAFSQRLANHVELFGHYIYNYVDGFFYDGNPGLKPETTINNELSVRYERSRFAFSTSLFYNYLFNYIDGLPNEELSNQFYQFKTYENIGDAVMTGAELRILLQPIKHLHVDARASYLYAQNTTLNDPLPLISPLNGSVQTSYSHKVHSFSVEVDWASAQNRIAEITSIEDETDGFVILNMSYEKRWFGNTITSVLAVNNLFDTFYNRHTSLENIPEAGRNLLLSISYNF